MFRYLRSAIRFLAREDGPTAVEYAVMTALVIIACITVIQQVGGNASGKFDKVSSAMLGGGESGGDTSEGNDSSSGDSGSSGSGSGGTSFASKFGLSGTYSRVQGSATLTYDAATDTMTTTSNSTGKVTMQVSNFLQSQPDEANANSWVMNFNQKYTNTP